MSVQTDTIRRAEPKKALKEIWLEFQNGDKCFAMVRPMSFDIGIWAHARKDALRLIRVKSIVEKPLDTI